jgi:hypothetical protein
MAKRKKDKQWFITLNTENKKPEVNSSAPEGLVIPALLVTLFVLLFKRLEHHLTWKSFKFSVYCLVDNYMSFFAIVLSVLQFTVSDYPFGIFKLFLCNRVFQKDSPIMLHIRHASCYSPIILHIRHASYYKSYQDILVLCGIKDGIVRTTNGTYS